MPIYEYRCNHCGNEFEELLLGRDKEPELCPSCNSKEISRKISSTSFTLTGKGWYVTDYGGYNPGAVPSESSDSGKGGESAATSSETESSKTSSSCGCSSSGCHSHSSSSKSSDSSDT